MTFPIRRILTPRPKLSRHSTAIEDSLKASSRRVLPALQVGGGCSDSQEMAGALWMLRRGERWRRVKEMGVQPQADLAGAQGVVGDHAAFHKGKAA